MLLVKKEGGLEMSRRIKNWVFGGMVLALLALPWGVEAKTYVVKSWELSLGNVESGTTPVPSGVSPMIVNNNTGVSTIYIGKFQEGAFVVQLESWSGVSVGWAERVKGGDNSGVSGTLFFKETAQNTQEHWDAAEKVYVWSGFPVFSGASLQQVPIDPEALGYIGFWWESGVTIVRFADFIFKIID